MLHSMVVTIKPSYIPYIIIDIHTHIFVYISLIESMLVLCWMQITGGFPSTLVQSSKWILSFVIDLETDTKPSKLQNSKSYTCNLHRSRKFDNVDYHLWSQRKYIFMYFNVMLNISCIWSFIHFVMRAETINAHV